MYNLSKEEILGHILIAPESIMPHILKSMETYAQQQVKAFIEDLKSLPRINSADYAEDCQMSGMVVFWSDIEELINKYNHV